MSTVHTKCVFLFAVNNKKLYNLVSQVQTLSSTSPSTSTSVSKQPQRVRKRTKVLSIARKYAPTKQFLILCVQVEALNNAAGGLHNLVKNEIAVILKKTASAIRFMIIESIIFASQFSFSRKENQ